MSTPNEHPDLVPAPAPKPPPTAAPAPVEPILTAEDAGAQALAEALGSSFKIVKFLMVGLVVLFVVSGIYTVAPNQLAVKLNFGKPAGTGAEQLLKPGLHWAWPRPVDEIVFIAVGESHSVMSSVGWYATPQEEAKGQLPPLMPVLRPGVDGYTISADGSIMHARAILKYRIQPGGAMNYAFNFANPTNLLQNILNNAISYASAQVAADAAIFKEKVVFHDLVRQRVSELIDKWQLGITIDSLDVQTSPPRLVQGDFDAVLTAQQTAATEVSKAEAYARGATNMALGAAAVVRSEGNTRSNQIVRNIAAFATSFNKQLPYYTENPTFFKQRLMTETMELLLTNAQEKYFLPTRADGKPRELRLQISPEPPKAGGKEPGQ